MTFAAKSLEQWSQCYQELENVNPTEDIVAFEKVISPQRLMASLGLNTRNEREQGLVSQLQNTSLQQPKLLQQQSQSFSANLGSNLSNKSASNISYGTPIQSA